MVPLPSRQQLIRWAIVKMYYNFGEFLIQLPPIIRSRPIHGVIKILWWLKNIFPPLLFLSLVGPDQGALAGVPCDKVRVFFRTCNKLHFLWNRWGSFHCFQTGLSQLWDFCVPFSWYSSELSRESFWYRHQKGAERVPLPLLVFSWMLYSYFSSFGSVAQSCPTLCDPMNCSMPGLPVHHQLPEFTQTHVHRVCDAIQPSHPLSSPSPPAPNPSQHQSLFQ